MKRVCQTFVLYVENKMIRTKNIPKPSAILTADWHLREDQPVCRTDDFGEAQWRKVNEVKQMQAAFNCPVIHSGDLFNHWKPSPHLLSETIKNLPDQFYTVYGNHDLPQHNLDLSYKSGVHTLIEAGKVKLLVGVHWGQLPGNNFFQIDDKKILVWHIMNYQGRKPWPGCTDPSSASLIRKHPQYDLILTGHNHKTFVEELDGRYLVNPGSITRQDADQATYDPCVFLWYAENNTVEKHILQHDKDVITRAHLDHTAERDARIDAFITKLDGDWQAGMSFEDNLEQFKSINHIKESVMEIIYKSIES